MAHAVARCDSYGPSRAYDQEDVCMYGYSCDTHIIIRSSMIIQLLIYIFCKQKVNQISPSLKAGNNYF